MPVSAVSSCGTKHPAYGFTLIELLVVIVVLAVLMGMVTVAFNPASDQRALQTYAQRFAQRIELARDLAIQNNQEWGLKIATQDYQFVVFDELEGRWMPQLQSSFKPDEAPYPLSFRLEILDGTGDDLETGIFATEQNQIDNDEDTDITDWSPNVVFFSSGEASQFAIDVLPEAGELGFRLATDGLQQVSVVALSEEQAFGP
jgi:general secretion pathway protein H